MVPANSQIDFYVELLLEVLMDNPVVSFSTRSTRRDCEEIRKRCLNEGLGFLTKSLPQLGRALDQGLTSMRFVLPSGWKAAHKASVPAFLQEHFKRIFNADGGLLDGADPACVSHIRQVCFCLYKLELPFDERHEEAVIANFVSSEEELPLPDDLYATDEIVGASYVIRDALGDFDHRRIRPRHGPGAVSTGEKLDDKWEFSRLYPSIDSVYPYCEYFAVGSVDEMEDRPGWIDRLRLTPRGLAKVVLVPKDSRGPRLISAEPLEYQFIQQGLGRALMSHVESSRATRGQVNFTNQEVNRKLALESSRTLEWATLDLKDASDRVSVALVRSLFAHVPGLLMALLATRTSATLLPKGRLIELRKFAPMGSALCFPIEALCFWAICVSAVSRATGILPRESGKMIFVYGDDIICRTEHADICMQALERYGLKVNRSKSCISGHFRESCGMDAFKGVQVTPTRVKKVWNPRPSDGTTLAAYTAFANHMGRKGYKAAADFIWKKLASVFGAIPYGLETSDFPCRWVSTYSLALKLNFADRKVGQEYGQTYKGVRWNRDYQHFEFLVSTIRPFKRKTRLKGWARLLRDLLVPSVDGDPSVVVIPRTTKIKRGWRPV